MDVGKQWEQWNRLRGRVPAWHPVGVVIEADGPVVRRHYGIHGTAEHAPLEPGTDLTGLVRRQQVAFAERGEPVEWKVYGHDSPGLGPALVAAGFTPGTERSVLIADTLAGAKPHDVQREPHEGVYDLYRVRDQAKRTWEIAVGSPGLHAVPYAEMIADGSSDEGDVLIQVLLEDGLVTAVAWAHGDEQPFTIIGGLTSDDADFVRACTDRWRHDSWLGCPLLAEADGPLRARLLEAGFTEATTVRSYHWQHPPGAPEPSRPAQFLDWLHDDGPLWDRFYADFDFKPSTTYRPAITEPSPSAVWNLHSHHQLVPDLHAELDAIVQRGLLAATEPGEFVYWLDWQHDGYRYDPRRTAMPGRPPRPGLGTYPNGDYYLHLTHDLRLGTFGHPWEQTLTVWGSALLTTIEGQLTELLGEPIRRQNGAPAGAC